MRFAIDVAMIDRDAVVLEVRRSVKAWRIVTGPAGTHAVIETADGGFGSCRSRGQVGRCDSRSKDFRSPVRTDWARLRRYHDSVLRDAPGARVPAASAR
jgi:hypothetical protein